ncbi:uncharacterized protein K452DRAFT_237420 [Aplosporella prunicola CBS 121167]|uniref:Aquaporin-like protein n=1 Tax=Aplosporella prunicola CBS 121167 TaxID=1176127 RepID=A0A6A6AZ06_9PEZI|nr:uncharacterized protein K452DRAFT_237420 [Aplosporella prunicola CBS 121167]KAF2136498.1 hypothetical protein K452DRAFT_237420 [Aplosporella prunicola CBS 121167]
MTLPRTSAGGATLLRRPTLLQSGAGESNPGFTLAGPPEPAVANQHQPYVDPGYSQLNPSYEQPINVRPVWGLAKPLPRVIRPGMVPTPLSGTPAENPDLEQKGEFPFEFPNPDPEKGRVDAGINLGKVSSRLNDLREQREANFLQKVGSRTVPPPSTLAPTASQQSPGRESPVEPQQGAPSTLTPHAEEPEAEEAADEAASQSSHAHPSSRHQAFSFQGRSSLAQGRSEDGMPTTQYGYRDDVSEAATEFDDQANWADEPADLALHEFDIEDEIHNNHTHWSVIRTKFREPLAELLATTVQLTLGFCADLAGTTTDGGSLDPGSTSLAWGLASMIGIYIAGGISGAHLNPAVSIMLWIYRGFPLRKVPGYVFAQVLGAFLAALISYGLYRTSILAYGGANLATGGTANAFLTNPRYAYIDASTAFFNEFVPTAILAIAILALGDDTNAPPGAGMSAFIMGMVITCESMAFSHGTGNAMNPSRDFGPRLALLALGYGGGTFRNAWWVYGPWCATISGAVVGGALYDVAIFVGGESPINYPARRIKRANRKWRRKWARRLHLQRRGGGRSAEVPFDKRYT